MSGAEIRAEVAAALAEAGEETGDGPYYCTIRRETSGAGATPLDPTPDPAVELFEITGVEGTKEIRDASGALTGIIRRTLTVEAGKVSPLKSDTIAPGVRQADVDADTAFEEIVRVTPLSPGGTALLYKIELAR